LVVDAPTPRAGPLNMAIDEILLGSARSAIVRFYRWSEPSLSFGYFVRFDETRAVTGSQSLVRRWTGGGIVPHGEDLTYSIMIGSDDDVFALPSKIIYQRVHSALSSALREIGITAELIAIEAQKKSDVCFANPVSWDVIENGRKIAGAAQRKTRTGLLHQGSIQRADLTKEFKYIFSKLLANRLISSGIRMGVVGAAEELATVKYATDGWLRRR